MNFIINTTTTIKIHSEPSKYSKKKKKKIEKKYCYKI